MCFKFYLYYTHLLRFKFYQYLSPNCFIYMGSGFIPLLVGTIMYVGMWALRSFSDKAVQGFSIQSGYAVGSTFP